MLQLKENEETIMVGRTHGQHASPITLGLKFAVYLSEIGRHLEVYFIVYTIILTLQIPVESTMATMKQIKV